MIAVKETASPLTRSGVYMVAPREGVVRALVDPRIAKALPRLQRALAHIGQILQHCLAGQDLAVSVTFEPAPQRSARSLGSCVAGWTSDDDRTSEQPPGHAAGDSHSP